LKKKSCRGEKSKNNFWRRERGLFCAEKPTVKGGKASVYWRKDGSWKEEVKKGKKLLAKDTWGKRASKGSPCAYRELPRGERRQPKKRPKGTGRQKKKIAQARQACGGSRAPVKDLIPIKTKEANGPSENP